MASDVAIMSLAIPSLCRAALCYPLLVCINFMLFASSLFFMREFPCHVLTGDLSLPLTGDRCLLQAVVKDSCRSSLLTDQIFGHFRRRVS